MSAATTFLLGTVLLAASGAGGAGGPEARLLEAQRLYDETAARSLIDEQWASVGVDTTDEERALFVRGLLLLRPGPNPTAAHKPGQKLSKVV